MTKQLKSRKSTKAKIVSIHSKTSKLRHFKLVPRKHSAKLVAHHHTSYIGLAIILAIVGLVVYSSRGVWATPPPISHDVSITAHVPGPPPSQGAVITSPADGTTFTDQNMIDISGTCEDTTLVVVSSNGSTVGSANCSGSTFTLTTQLDAGQNVLSAKNYDFDNQAGPDTPDVTITLNVTAPPPSTPPVASGTTDDSQTTPAVAGDTQAEEQAAPPENPAAIINDADATTVCDNQKVGALNSGGKLKVAVDCIPRVFKANVTYSVGFQVSGGSAPYAVDIDWGDGKTPHTLISLTSASYKTVHIVYAEAGSYTIKVKVSDSQGLPAYVQTAATVAGDNGPIAAITNAITHAQWFNTPVPAYSLAVTLTVGFWASQAFTHFVAGPAGAHLMQHFRPRHKLIKR